MKFKVDDFVVINENAIRDLPDSVGKYGHIKTMAKDSPNFDYRIDLGNEIVKVKEKEIEKIVDFTFTESTLGGKVLYTITNEFASINGVDLKNNQVSIRFSDGGSKVVEGDQLKLVIEEGEQVEEKGKAMVKGTDYFQTKGSEIGSLVTRKQAAYGDSVGKASKLMRIFLEDYKNEDNTYTIPEELLDHILLQVRIIDKQNRIFSNPKGDLMGENPYQDKVGYALLGMRMADQILEK